MSGSGQLCCCQAAPEGFLVNQQQQENYKSKRIAMKLIEINTQVQNKEKAPWTVLKKDNALSIDKRDIQIIKFHQRNQQHIVLRHSINFR